MIFFCVMICSLMQIADHDYTTEKERKTKHVSYELNSVFCLPSILKVLNHSLMITCRLKITIKFCSSNQFKGGLSALGHVLTNIYCSL